MRQSAGRMLVAAALVAATAGPALAADIWTPPVQGPVVEPVPVEFGSNWYLRGDIGYRTHAEPSGEYRSGAFPTCTLCNGPYEDEEIAESVAFGVGAGYKISPWLRADVTADYMAPAGFRATFTDGGGPEDHKADISSWSFLANGYVDIDTGSRVTPYVGAGVGTSRHRIKDYWVDNDGTYVDDSDGEWNLAWAVMAGVAVDLTPSLSLDLGYRYLSLGEATTTDTVGNRDVIKIDDINAHEARVGVRFMLD